MSYNDVVTTTAVVACGASINEIADTLEVRFYEIAVEAHYWAEPTEREHGVNRPDYIDEINVFAKDKSQDGLLCDRDRAEIENECIDMMRKRFCEIAGKKLTFSRNG